MRNLFITVLTFATFSTLAQSKISKKVGQISKSVVDVEMSDFGSYDVSPDLRHKLEISILLDSATLRIDPQNSVPNQPLTNIAYLEGGKNIQLFTNISRDSLAFYRYTIIENDQKVLVDDAKLNDQFLGKFDVSGKKLTLIYYKITDRGKARKIIIYSKSVRKAKIEDIALLTFKLDTILGSKVSTYNIDSKDTRGIKIWMQNTDLNEVYDLCLSFKNSEGQKYTKLGRDWVFDGNNPNPSMLIDEGYFEQTGTYEIIIRPRIGRNFGLSDEINVLTYKINVVRKSSDGSSNRYWAQLGMSTGFVSLIILLIIIFFIKRKARRKLLAEQHQKDIAKTQLASIRSQLNPHFMFNALAGIQSLMNEQKTSEANQYLNKFSRLTRNVLDNKELISLAEEKTLLDDYLQMEQLRFGFKYEIKIEQDVDLNIEIPAMLLQPFVENAVKHGIAEKGKHGEVCINFIKQGKNLILELKDNGKGFDTSKTYEGYGLQLSKNRILLLNGIYKEDTILLTMNSESEGTNITITLTDWL